MISNITGSLIYPRSCLEKEISSINMNTKDDYIKRNMLVNSIPSKIPLKLQTYIINHPQSNTGYITGKIVYYTIAMPNQSDQ